MLLNQYINNIKVSRRFLLLLLLGGGIKISLGVIKFGKNTQNHKFNKQNIKRSYEFSRGHYGLNSYGV